jgi:hypothetical protein
VIWRKAKVESVAAQLTTAGRVEQAGCTVDTKYILDGHFHVREELGGSLIMMYGISATGLIVPYTGTL